MAKIGGQNKGGEEALYDPRFAFAAEVDGLSSTFESFMKNIYVHVFGLGLQRNVVDTNYCFFLDSKI
jgi:hypothetical protein